MNLIIIGANGLVGSEFINILNNFDIPFSLKLTITFQFIFLTQLPNTIPIFLLKKSQLVL